ncbi:MAG TPA: AcrB/AcrD/AcrF family protein [Algoriphagus sp.]|jgi:multidrug efflux pump|uniref:Multidrug efflux pump n=1 Tax=Algoriphagus ornithinivorans TaxID=226506 RepID=A0A1I5K1C7_9BACT|nr:MULTISPECIES: efflux RND transporter permease subunit [Algoriphagus]MAL13516.1 AcrB/AcrD/AcrF family protein [Algoriphagus sp.]MAN88688.1 AcrB/AcrD/AcrF family protein [Algoriphagus sp.]QYH40259.1 efflux RND transporter permease subunit [Algoriphagus sp. NBT04N3]SFO78790.1 multidrug efflux pump [Algoriphagus ornithinivorans]HAS59402.1 AcrB/AcrD/AcrF family protein [Algoriphagus sp.]
MASLSNLSINRPVLAIVMSLIILLFGAIGISLLGIREFPSVDPPIINVRTNYVGANADVIEAQITEPLEEAINGIQGIKSLTSTSNDGASSITVEFDVGADLEAAANDVRDKVSGAQRNLPPDAEPPVVSKADADSQPIVFLNVKSDERSLLDLSDIAQNIFKERLQTIPGVSRVQIWGEKEYAIRLRMDPLKMASYGVTPLDVLSKVQSENVELPSGRIEGETIELSVRTKSRLSSPQEFNQLIIKESENNIVRFQDVGKAELAALNERTVLKRDGVPMVGVVLVPLPGSNNIEIVDEFYRRLEFIKKDLPADVGLEIGFDSTTYIRNSIAEVQETIITAFILVVAIIFLFLRDWRTTFIPVLTIPISLIGVFFVMYLMDFSINVLTLLGIVLSIGLVVDDAIVVLENIYARIEKGEKPLQAAQKGAEEIFFAVIATTVALAAVFLPVIFLTGTTGRLFREFGIVVAGSVIISSFVALTMTPMLSSKLLKRREKHNWFYNFTEPGFVWLNNQYDRALSWFMNFRWVAFLLIIFMGGGIYWLFNEIPSELAPTEDRGELRINMAGPEGATFDYMDRVIDQMVGDFLESFPEEEVSGLISVTSPGFGTASTNSGFVRFILTDAENRSRSQNDIFNEVNAKLRTYTSVRAFAAQPQSIGDRRGGLPVQYVLQAPTLEKLKEKIPTFMEEVNKSDKFIFADINLKFTKPELEIEIDREKARNIGVSVQEIARTLQLSYSGQRFAYFIMNGKQYQVVGEMQIEDRNEPINLRMLYVRAENGQLVQLDNLVTVVEKSTPPQLYRFNRFVSATVSANLAEGFTIGDGLDEMDRIAAEVLDDSFATDVSGPSKEFRESSNSLIFAFLFALVLIYLVLSAQFESFLDPLTIMFTVPLAIFGALLTLWAFDFTLNIFSQIGIIMLIGLVTKNGILIVEFANQRKASGMDVKEAIYGAAVARFRPILMTSLSTILGILPIALALGAGAESRVPMGAAVIGGLAFATILTLFIIPAIYTYLTSKEGRLARI